MATPTRLKPDYPISNSISIPNSSSREQDPLSNSKSNSRERGALQRHMYLAVSRVLKPRSPGDRTTLSRICRQALDRCDTHAQAEESTARLVDYAKEAASGQARSPWAVFLHIVKTEIGYGK